MKVKFMAIIAAVMLLAVPVHANAADKFDVNGDGEVNMVDALIVQKFLMGMGTVPDVAKLDFNGDKMVSKLDAEYINKYVMIGTTCTWNYVKYNV